MHQYIFWIYNYLYIILKLLNLIFVIMNEKQFLILKKKKIIFFMSDDYKESDEIAENSHNESKYENIFSNSLEKSTKVEFEENDFLYFSNLVVEYCKMKNETDDYVSLKPIYKFLKEKRIIIHENSILKIQYFEFDEVFSQFVLILLTNIKQYSSLYEYNKSLRILPCFLECNEYIKIIEENKGLLYDIINNILEKQTVFPDEISYLLFKYIIVTEDYGIAECIDYHKFFYLLEPRFLLSSSAQTALNYLHYISTIDHSSEYQKTILDYLIQYPILPNHISTFFLEILNNFIKSIEFDANLFLSFFNEFQDDSKNFFRAFFIPQGDHSESINENIYKILPYFAKTYSLLIQRDPEFLHFLPIDFIYNILQTYGEDEIHPILYEQDKNLFDFVSHAVNLNPKDPSIIQLGELLFDKIKDFAFSSCLNDKKSFFFNIGLLLPNLLPDHINPDDFFTSLEFLEEVLNVFNDCRTIEFLCFILNKIKAVIDANNLQDIKYDFMGHELISTLHDKIMETEMPQLHNVDNFLVMFAPENES